MTVTKTAAKNVQLPVGSATALLAYAKDADNWGGNPWVDGNVNFGRSTGGYIAKLVDAGMITVGDDGDQTYVIFTDKGIDAALALGAPESLNLYRSTPVDYRTADAPKKSCKKGADHEYRVTKSGGYCYTCDRVVAERQKAERAAAKAAK